MKYKVGDKVKIKSREWYEEYKSQCGAIKCKGACFVPEMAQYCGRTATIIAIGDIYIGHR